VRHRRLSAVIAVGLTVAACAAASAYAAYRAVATNSANSFAAGTVALSDNDSGTAMFTSLTSARANDSETSCIRVRSDGTLNATVRLYASVSGSLAPYLTLTVTRGTDANPVFDNCTTFVADSTNYIGSGLGVIYSGALSSFPTTYSAGIVDPAVGGGTETWSQNEIHIYKFVLSAGTNTAAQGLSATAGFTWDARNL
jgi:hypothetical protein